MTTDERSPFADPPPITEPHRKRKNWRLRAMLALTAIALGLYVFVRLERSVAERLGPVAEGIHDLFNQVPGKAAPLTAAARQLSKDVVDLGGDAGVNVTKPGYLGTIGQEEWFNVTFHNPGFDDAALARLAEAHGAKIGGLYLENTGVTDEGLKHLGKFTKLRHLSIRNTPLRSGPNIPAPTPKITDAGMANLRGLDHLWSLNLGDLPITDAGLAAIDDLSELMALYLGNTKVEGRGLSRMKSLPRLNILYLDGSRFSESGLRALAGATGLQFLSLNQVPLTPDALPLIGAIPKLERLEITGCGFLDEEVDGLKKARPSLKIMRK